jgi:molecular chaperone HtpG
MRIRIPDRWRELLATSPHEAASLDVADVVTQILTDNKTPFFPAYTDHGAVHVARVLDAAARLVPDTVWSADIMSGDDASVALLATLLHDLGMHLREDGFVHLVSARSERYPLPWFRDRQGKRSPDHPWSELWARFQREARHLGQSDLDRLLGPDNQGVPRVAYEESPRPACWTKGDYLLIGEFLRRHHARLSHEIAIYGLPGEPDALRPLSAIPHAAEMAGLVARSHNEPLRLMLRYLDYRQPGNLRPHGAFAVYLMGLLRIADYLQIDAERAPRILMRLRRPVSQQSVEAWDSHSAVARISWEHRDPLAIFVEVLPNHGLRTHLALRDLLAGLEQELDTTAAVLDEVYGRSGLEALRLSRQRIYTNLDDVSLYEMLPFVPRRAELRSDDDLFRLVVGALYGPAPSVAGRELVQNAVDAVRERRRLEDLEGAAIDPTRFRDQDVDVIVCLEELEDGDLVLRVSDRGIGMEPDVVIDYFLKAGASYRLSDDERGDSDVHASPILKAGRFGVGAFAGFLLGPTLHVETRHVSALRGLRFRTSIDDELVELRWTDAPLGSEVWVRLSPTVLHREKQLPLTSTDLLQQIANYYWLDDPAVKFELIKRSGERLEITKGGAVPAQVHRAVTWREVEAPGLDGVYWREPRRKVNVDDGFAGPGQARVVHNGIIVSRPFDSRGNSDETYKWSSPELDQLLLRPGLAVFDTGHRLNLALHRYTLQVPHLPFEDELLASIGRDLVALSLVGGPRLHPLALTTQMAPLFTRSAWVPRLPGLVHRYVEGLVLSTSHGTAELEDSRREGGEIDLGLLAAPEGPIPWGTFAARMIGLSSLDDSSLKTVARLDVFADRPGASEVREHALKRSSWLPGAQHYHVFMSPAAEQGAELETALVDAARALVIERGLGRTADLGPNMARGRYFRTLQLSVLRRGDEEPELSPLEAPWVDLLGGGLERDPRARAARADSVSATDDGMGELIAKWREVLPALRASAPR